MTSPTDFALSRFSFVGIVALCFGSTQALADNCRPFKVTDGAIVVGEVWSGTKVGFAAIEHNGVIFLGYYDSVRQLTVASVDRKAGLLCISKLASTYNGWDSHNYITLAFDDGERLHVAGNMHATPLIYGTTTIRDSISGLHLTKMVGNDEAEATYPSFVKDTAGRLLFLYRSGISGAGKWFVNRFENGRWSRLGHAPIFSGRSAGGTSVSAYPSAFIRSDDGIFHVAVVWRHTIDVATNFKLSYAETDDFISWRGADGRGIATPLTPESMDSVDNTGENSGLLNAQKVATRNGLPLIAYTRYDSDGFNALIIARPKDGRWKTSIIAISSRKIAITGGGSIDDLPVIDDLDANNDSVVFAVRGSPTLRYGFDPETLAARGVLKREFRPPVQIDTPAGLVDGRVHRVNVINDTTGTPTGDILEYISQSVNRDRPRQCTRQAALACNPPPTTARLILGR